VSGATAERVRLDAIADCFEGVIPSPLVTCSASGIPNVTYLSIVHRIDDQHVALSVQFFNKTRRNVLENPRAQLILVAPGTLAQYRLDIAFERTETSGPTFEYVRTRLEAVASQTGMTGVFVLRGVDVYRVLDCVPLAGDAVPEPPAIDEVGCLGRFTGRLMACRDLESLLAAALEQLAAVYGCEHAFVMARNEQGTGLYTLASRGFPTSGIGSEVAIGEGLIGKAAERRLTMRSTNLVRERLMSRAIRDEVTRAGDQGRLSREIPLPGLPAAQSQLVVPLVAHDDLIGVLSLQSETAGRFLARDERVLEIAGRHLAASMAMFGFQARSASPPEPPPASDAPKGGAVSTVKYYQSDDSVFIDECYLIKGSPGRILLKLLQAHLDEGRSEFTNKELRLDQKLGLGEFSDNLEARLILLRRRLEERCAFIALSRTGRGRLHLAVGRRLRLEKLP
jgi:adenylate cyclase